MGIAFALLLGAVEGATEFLPVSSTAHLILLGHLLGLTGEQDKLFFVVIQVGAALALLQRYAPLYKSWTAGLLERKKEAWHFALWQALALLPAVVLGAFFHDAIKHVLFTPQVVGATLLLGGMVLALAEVLFRQTRFGRLGELSLRHALAIGFFQAMALVPGVSRSAAIIVGARSMGCSKRLACECSFLLALPILSAAALYDLYSSRFLLAKEEILILGLGLAAAFLSAYAVCQVFVEFVEKRGLFPFAFYRLALGSLVLLMF